MAGWNLEYNFDVPLDINDRIFFVGYEKSNNSLYYVYSSVKYAAGTPTIYLTIYRIDLNTKQIISEIDNRVIRSGVQLTYKYGNYIYIVPTYTFGTYTQTSLNSFYVYNVITKEFKTVPGVTIPFPGSDPATVLVSYMGTAGSDNTLYVIGGDYWYSLSKVEYKSIYAYDARTSQPPAKYSASLPLQLEGPSCAYKDNKLYIYGGKSIAGNVSTLYILNLETGNISVNNGTTIPNYNSPYNQASISDKYRFYSHLSDGIGRFNVYDIRGNTWELIDYGKPYTSTKTINYIGSCIDGNKLYLTINVHNYSYDTIGEIKTYSVNLGFSVITNPTPAGGFQNEQDYITLSWLLTDGYEQVQQRSATVQWRNGTSGAIQSFPDPGAQQSIIVPPNTFPNTSTLQWRVMATDIEGNQSEWTEWLTFTTIDSVPLAPTNLNPAGAIDGTKQQSFTWRHNIPSNTPQRAYEVQFTYYPDSVPSGSEGIWQSVSGKVTTSSSLFLTNPDSIKPVDPQGRIAWRVRTYNTDDVVSPWSAVVYLTIEAAPDPPVWESVETTSNRPLCKWVAPQQTIYQLQVLWGDEVAYDSGNIPGDTPEHKLTKPLKGGQYTFAVRVGNNRGYWSDWSYYVATLPVSRVFRIRAFEESAKNGAGIGWEVDVL